MNDRREIKFCGKRIDNNEWVYGHYFVSPLTDENSGTTPDKGWFFLSGEKRHCIEQNHVSFVVDPETISQFTGLHDKNGKEIYEGDTVAHNGKVRQTELLLVEFVDGAFCLTGEKKTMKENNSCTIRDLMFQAKKCDMELELTIVSTRRANANP